MANDYDRAREALERAGLNPDQFVDGPTTQEQRMQSTTRSLRGDGIPPGAEPTPPPLGARDYHEMAEDGFPPEDRAAAILGSWIGGAVDATARGELRPGGTFDPMGPPRNPYASNKRARHQREVQDAARHRLVQEWAAEGRR